MVRSDAVRALPRMTETGTKAPVWAALCAGAAAMTTTKSRTPANHAGDLARGSAVAVTIRIWGSLFVMED